MREQIPLLALGLSTSKSARQSAGMPELCAGHMFKVHTSKPSRSHNQNQGVLHIRLCSCTCADLMCASAPANQPPGNKHTHTHTHTSWCKCEPTRAQIGHPQQTKTHIKAIRLEYCVKTLKSRHQRRPPGPPRQPTYAPEALRTIQPIGSQLMHVQPGS